MGVSANALAPGSGRRGQFLFIQAGQAPVVEQLLAAHPKVLHTIASGGVDQRGDRVVDRLLGHATEVEGDDVRGLAQFQAADFAIQAQGPRAVEGGHAQRAMGIQGAGGAGDSLGQQGGGTGFAEQVQVIVARRAIGAYGHIDAGLP